MTKSLPGMCGKPRKFDGVVEAVAAGREALVAAGGHGEGVAGRDRLRHRLPQLERDRAALVAVVLHLDRKPGIGAAGEGELAGGEPAVVESIEPARRVKADVAGERGDRAAAVIGRRRSRSTVQRASPRSAEQVAV